MNKVIKISLGHLKLWLRPLDEYNLLGFCGMIPTRFIIDKPEVSNGGLDPLQIAKQIDTDSEKEQTKIKANLILDNLIKYKNKGRLDLEDVLKSKPIVKVLFNSWREKSIKPKSVIKINKEKAISIYLLYKGMNYSEQYFGKKLSPLDEYNFNSLIYSVGYPYERKMNNG